MGVIQNSVNQALGTIGIATRLVPGIEEYSKARSQAEAASKERDIYQGKITQMQELHKAAKSQYDRPDMKEGAIKTDDRPYFGALADVHEMKAGATDRYSEALSKMAQIRPTDKNVNNYIFGHEMSSLDNQMSKISRQMANSIMGNKVIDKHQQGQNFDSLIKTVKDYPTGLGKFGDIYKSDPKLAAQIGMQTPEIKEAVAAFSKGGI